MTTDKDREEFEKFATDREYDLSIEPAFELAKDWSVRYISKETRNLARGWQASAARSGAVQAEWREAMDLGAQMLSWGDEDGLSNGQEREIAAHQKAMFALVRAAAPEPPQGEPDYRKPYSGCSCTECAVVREMSAPDSPEPEAPRSGDAPVAWQERRRGVAGEEWRQCEQHSGNECWEVRALYTTPPADALRLALNLRMQTLHNAIYEYGVPDGHPLHQMVHEAISATQVTESQCAELLDAATRTHIDDLNAQASALRGRLNAPADARDGDVDKLRAFANAVIADFQEFDPDIQELAEKHGLLVSTEVSESCGEGCICAEVGFPADCYRKTSVLKPPADRAMGGE